MKKLIPFILFPFIISCNAQNDPLKENKGDKLSVSDTLASPIDLSAKDFRESFDPNKHLLLDVRTPEETSVSFIDGASFINFYDTDFETKINTMDKSKEVYVYCKGGGRSSKAAEILFQNGFKKVHNLEGGIVAWENAGLPTEEGKGGIVSNAIVWQINEFEELISKDKLSFVSYKTAWCAPCKKMEPILDSLENKYSEIQVLKIDFDANKELVSKYAVKAIPTNVIYQNGKALWTKVGFLSYTEIENELNKFAN
jgi:rhodanese-related sulfurtransferase